MHRDKKSGAYFFRYKLPVALAQRLGKVSMYLSLRTKDYHEAKTSALLLNYHLEMSRKKPIAQQFNPDDARELLKIDLKNGIFEADTPEELKEGLKVLELMRIAGAPDHIEQVGVLPTPYVAQAVAQVQPKRSSPKYSVVVEEYFKDAQLALKPSTLYKQQQSFKLFAKRHNDLSFSEYGKDEIKSFKSHLLAGEKTGHTVNQYLSHLKSLFEYAIGHDYYFGENPVDGLMVKGAKKVVTPREQFHHSELKEIYKWENYEWLVYNKPDYFWGPLICLFSGLRIEEATSLSIRNIKENDGVPFFNIQDAKTRSGVRMVPIHSTLIRLGLLDYIEEVGKAGHEKLFWYLVDGHNGTKKNLSRRFSLHLKRLKLKENSNCFHSLRHTVITRLAAQGVNNSTIYLLTGHISSDDAKNAHFEYLHDLPMLALQRAVEKLDFGNIIDLSGYDYKPSLQNVLKHQAPKSKPTVQINRRKA
ncbi:hypothetical protein DIE14_15750 [Burkholderia sp. Bp9017]|nr:hypothetical protein DIE14_15750 [Burkholderia sp. Bp9017]